MAIKIFVDPGHNPSGTFNTGAEGNGFFEQDITFRIGTQVYERLRANPNFEVQISRPTKDTVLGTNNSTSLSARVKAANAFGADLFLSLHTNASADSTASGSEGLVYSEKSKVAVGVATEILEKMHTYTGLRNRGIIARPGLYVLRKTKMPAVIIEMGFITNPYDASLMVYSPSLFSGAIYRGILTYYGLA